MRSFNNQKREKDKIKESKKHHSLILKWSLTAFDGFMDISNGILN